jgi:MFS family permease
MSRRWSILGLTNAITVAVAGQVLELFNFPINYQVVFLGLSIGGLLSFYYSSRISLPDSEPPPSLPGRTIGQRLSEYFRLVMAHPDFVNFSIRRFVFQFGILLAAPLLPLYYVREVGASDAWIGYFSTAQTATLLVGYFVWPRQSRKRGSRFVILCSTLALSLYPALVAATQEEIMLVLLAAFAGVFQAGLDLVFFDELMKTVPVEYSATFVSLAQSMTYLATVIAPLAGTWLSDQIGLTGALIASALVRLFGFALFTAPGLIRGRRGTVVHTQHP